MAGFYENRQEEERVILVEVKERGEQETDASLEELSELVKTAGAFTVGKMVQNLEYANPVTYLGKGKLDELKTKWEQEKNSTFISLV